MIVDHHFLEARVVAGVVVDAGRLVRLAGRCQRPKDAGRCEIYVFAFELVLVPLNAEERPILDERGQQRGVRTAVAVIRRRHHPAGRDGRIGIEHAAAIEHDEVALEEHFARVRCHQNQPVSKGAHRGYVHLPCQAQVIATRNVDQLDGGISSRAVRGQGRLSGGQRRVFSNARRHLRSPRAGPPIEGRTDLAAVLRDAHRSVATEHGRAGNGLLVTNVDGAETLPRLKQLQAAGRLL